MQEVELKRRKKDEDKLRAKEINALDHENPESLVKVCSFRGIGTGWSRDFYFDLGSSP